ncbi:YraN family protein [Engelhardtia mirabilis]|uniref:Uncharacterized protein n=1 Tax=Engelhardtia mirabilis TaxID=2528011 RepID=A0A518BJK1_9BACT|nr:hypothetical protein Pla133_22390 [Planctomycetes bacterium Pla133]QDV01488.1 hypothetical protein Pla86_22390 [Planctomycetes bacterium Pla86]
MVAPGPLALLVRGLAVLAPRLALGLVEPAPHDLGRLGEALAERTLTRAGWSVVGRRLRTEFAEVDLLARRGSELRLVEVKTRRFDRDVPLEHLPYRPRESIGPRQRASLERAARSISLAAGRCPWRLTAAEVLVAGPRRRVTIRLTDLARGPRASAAEPATGPDALLYPSPRRVSSPDLDRSNR